jgi:hypothetical protein
MTFAHAETQFTLIDVPVYEESVREPGGLERQLNRSAIKLKGLHG